MLPNIHNQAEDFYMTPTNLFLPPPSHKHTNDMSQQQIFVVPFNVLLGQQCLFYSGFKED